MLHRLIRNDAQFFFYYYLIEDDDVQPEDREGRKMIVVLFSQYFFSMAEMVKVQIFPHRTIQSRFAIYYLQSDRKHFLAKSKVAFLVYTFFFLSFFNNFFGFHVRSMKLKHHNS